MGNVEKVDRTLPLDEMLDDVRKDAKLRRRWREDFDGRAREFGLSPDEIDAAEILGYVPSVAWRKGTGTVARPAAT